MKNFHSIRVADAWNRLNKETINMDEQYRLSKETINMDALCRLNKETVNAYRTIKKFLDIV